MAQLTIVIQAPSLPASAVVADDVQSAVADFVQEVTNQVQQQFFLVSITPG